jgi:glycosyltransferase involved in cell wall biosynthesis
MNIVLITNYLPDNQFSMNIFAELMKLSYEKSGIKIKIIRPKPFFMYLNFNKTKINKWLGYIDKFILFPIQILLFRFCNFLIQNHIQYHICDHSNAFYIYFLPKNKTIITCHDMLAILAGLGYQDTYCRSTKTGKILQKIILNALLYSNKIATVSKFTLNQLKSIEKNQGINKHRVVIHNVISNKFVPAPFNQIKKLHDKYGKLKNREFILHVGSNLERKNRKLLINLIFELKNEWDGIIVFAGESLSKELIDLTIKLNVKERVLSIIRPDDNEIRALYSSCSALVFPSYSEGFGWPIIEAQACGAPVITSNMAPMMNEVGGDAALYANPDDAKSFANQFLKLLEKEFKKDVIQLGFKNAQRFNFKNSISQYLELIKT